MRKPYRTARPNPRLLEPRMVFDAAGAAVATELATDTMQAFDLTRSIDDTGSLLMQQSQPLPVEPLRQIAFVDAALLKDGTVPGLAAGVELVALQPDTDGIAQIGAALAGRSEVSAIYIVSHGGAGNVTLGSTELDNATLAAHAADIASWAPHLSADADILFYGCQVGSGGDGMQLLQSLADLTGADIAASTNNTGPASLGGDWTLEASTGTVEAQGFASADALAQFDALLNVNVGSNSLTGWIAVTPANNQNDATNDQQTGSGSVSQDIVGDASYRAAYVKYDNGGTAGDLSDDWLAFRVRVNNQDNNNPASPAFKNFAFFGVDADGNGSIDFFAGVYNPANNSGRVGVYDANGAGNTGPSDTGINGTPAIKYDSTTTGYGSLYSVLATGDGSSFSGDIDYFVSFQVRIADINASKATFGLTNNITQSTVMRYIVGTAAQDNSFNQDVSGITGSYMSSTQTWTQLGAYTAPLQTDGTTPLVASADYASATEKGGTANGSAGIDPTGNLLTNDSGTGIKVTKVQPGLTVGVSASTVTASSTSTLNATTVSGSYGLLTIGADGSYSYAVNNANTTVQALRSSTDTLIDTFSYRITDSAAGTSDATLTVTLHGADDAPVITSGSSGSVAENAVITTAIHTATASDVDSGDTKTYSLKSGVGDQSLLNINAATGVVTLKTSADYEGKSSYTFMVVVTDTAGLTDEKAVTVAVTNVNEAPVATADTALATEKGGAANGTTGIDPSGNVLSNDSDADSSDTKTVSAISFGGASGTVGQALSGSYGSLTLDADGSYRYVLDNANVTVDALNAGGTLNDSFSYTVTDDNGLTSTATLTITIHGANDAPLASAVSAANATVGEAMTPVTVPLFADVDNGTLSYSATQSDGSALPSWLAFDAATRTFSGTPPAGSAATLTLRVTGSDGSLSDHVDFSLVVADPAAPQAADDVADATEAGGVANGTAGSDASGTVLANDSGSRLTVTRADAGNALGNGAMQVAAPDATDIAGSHGTLSLRADGSFAYEVANGNAAVQALNVGDTLTDTFSYEVTDPAGQTSTAIITITIHGANDAPVASAMPTTAATNGQPMNPFTVSAFSDVDNPTLNYSATLSDGSPLPSWLAFDTSTRTFSGTPPSTFTGTLGICVSGDDGQADAKLHFNLVIVNPGAPVAFDDSGSATEAGAAAGSDGSGDLLTNDVGTSISVNAIVAGNQFSGSGTAVGAGSTLAGGATQIDGQYGKLFIAADGGYRYELRDASPAVDALNAGDTLTDTFAYQMGDPSGQVATALLTITIDGANDAPVASAVSAANAIVGEAMTPVTVPAFTDVDSGTLSYSATLSDGSALPSWLAFDADTRTFSGTPPAGSVATLSLRVTGSDGSLSGHVDFNLVVANPAAPDAGNDAADATEAGGVANGTAGSDASGNALANDSGSQVVVTHVGAGHAPGSATLPVAGPNATDVTGSHGTLSLRADGSYSYRVAEGDAAVQALNVGRTLTDTFSYEVTDQAGQTSTATITITIRGANDAPVATVITASPVTGGSAMPAITVPAFADVDNARLSYTATLSDGSPLPAWLNFNPASRTFSGTPPATAGTLAIRVTGDDGRASDSVSFNLVINSPAPQPQTGTVLPPVVTAPVILPPAPPVPIQAPVDAPRLPEPTPIARATTSVSPSVPVELGKLQPLGERGPMDELYTDSRGFRVVVMPSNVQELSVFRGISDQFVERGSDVKFNLPQDAFVHARPDQVVRLSARQADGSPLPAWLQFDASNGSFAGTPPKDFRGEVRISVVARDGAGSEAAALFRLNVEEQRSEARSDSFSTSMRDALPFAPAMPPLPELPPEPAAGNAATEPVAEPAT